MTCINQEARDYRNPLCPQCSQPIEYIAAYIEQDETAGKQSGVQGSPESNKSWNVVGSEQNWSLPIIAARSLDAWGHMSKWLRSGELDIPEGMSEDEAQAFHSSTRLPSGESGILIDPGSKGNAAGDRWCMDHARKCIPLGREIEEKIRAKPLILNGVGKGSQQCTEDHKMPIAMRSSKGPVGGAYTTPVIPDSDVPALWGLDSLADLNAILDCGNRQLILPGDQESGGCALSLKPGAVVFDLKVSPSGHLILPVDKFEELPDDPSECPQVNLFLRSDKVPSAVTTTEGKTRAYLAATESDDEYPPEMVDDSSSEGERPKTLEEEIEALDDWTKFDEKMNHNPQQHD